MRTPYHPYIPHYWLRSFFFYPGFFENPLVDNYDGTLNFKDPEMRHFLFEKQLFYIGVSRLKSIYIYISAILWEHKPATKSIYTCTLQYQFVENFDS